MIPAPYLNCSSGLVKTIWQHVKASILCCVTHGCFSLLTHDSLSFCLYWKSNKAIDIFNQALKHFCCPQQLSVGTWTQSISLLALVMLYSAPLWKLCKGSPARLIRTILIWFTIIHWPECSCVVDLYMPVKGHWKFSLGFPAWIFNTNTNKRDDWQPNTKTQIFLSIFTHVQTTHGQTAYNSRMSECVKSMVLYSIVFEKLPMHHWFLRRTTANMISTRLTLSQANKNTK